MTPCRIATILVVLAHLAAPCAAQYAGARPNAPEKMRPGLSTIDPAQCKKWLTVLASDDFEGRKTGTEGYRKAASFVAARFKELGLTAPGDDGTYFQKVNLARLKLQPEKSSVTVKGKRSLELGGDDGLIFGACEGTVKGPAVLIRARGKQAKLADPSVLDGKIVLLNTRRTAFAPLARQLKDASPLAVIQVGRPRLPPRIAARQLQLADLMRIEVWTQRSTLRDILTALGASPELGDRIREDAQEVHLLQGELTIHAAAEREDFSAPNVVGLIEGSDPELKKEVVICGSHLDHIGRSRDGEINNGADDDGSGTTALLAVAKAFAENGKRPKRSVLFIAVCGEEDGLLGSSYYVENPIFPIEKTVCELQMDMVGRNEENRRKGERAEDNVHTTHLVGSKRLSMELHELALDVNRYVNFDFEYDEEQVWNRSDHYNFAKKGIPIVFVFSGFHKDYHRPTDTIEKINFEKIANTARLIYLLAYTVADKPERITVDKGPFKTKKDL